MKRILPAIILFSIFGSFLPTFLEPGWGRIEPLEWSPLPPPGVYVEIAEQPEVIDPSKLSETVPWRIINTDIEIQARFLTLPGTKELNSDIYRVLTEAISMSEGKTGKKYQPQAHAPGSGLKDRGCVKGSTRMPASKILGDKKLGPLSGSGSAVACDVVFAAGPLYAQTLRTVVGSKDAVDSDSSVTIYQDSENLRTWVADEIWADGAEQYMWDSLISTLKQSVGALSVFSISSKPDAELIRAAMKTSIPDSEGNLLVTFPAGVSSDELTDLGMKQTTEALTLKFPGFQISSYLSEFGVRLLEIAAADDYYYPPVFVFAGNDYVDCGLVPCAALTYDDGPGIYTPQILDAFLNTGSSATFYVLGDLAKTHPEIVARAHNEGHIVHGHSWNHANLSKIPIAEARQQMNQTNTVIYETTGEVPQTFRPPYGEYNDEVLKAAKMSAILWDVDTNDWQKPKPDLLVKRAVNDALPGSIILQHDIHQVTAETIYEVIGGLKDRGFSAVNIRQLFGGSLPSSGVFRNAR